MTDDFEQQFPVTVMDAPEPAPVVAANGGSTETLSGQPGIWQSSPVIEWLILDAWRLKTAPEITEELAKKLIETGIPLYRLFVMVPLLHPLYVGSGHIWRRGVEGIEMAYGEHGARDRPEYQNNPMRHILDEGYAALRRRVGDSYVEGEFPLVDDLVAEGGTDYVTMPLEFANGGRAAISFTSDAPEGFSSENLAVLYNMLPVLARLIERANLELTAINILDAYVGHTAGERILMGQITRGSRDTIYAGIWFCDLRDFTGLSDAMPRDEMIALLNSYFETMADPVLSHGGEVMKFIGDAMLAVFPVDNAQDKPAVCERMLQAADKAVKGMEHLNEERAMFGQNPINYGLALHIGQVAYGNIGAAGRLDFTVIGPAVNFAERIEQLCKKVPERPVLSEDFVRHCRFPVEQIGEFSLRGLPGTHAIFGRAAAGSHAAVELGAIGTAQTGNGHLPAS
ncbi:MAG: adenylate/guanylate cyclase domain-containing protein [Pseudomonadota bacterium]